MYEPLQQLNCRVIRLGQRDCVYEVLITQDNVTAELVCAELLSVGEEIIGLFGAFLENRYLLVAEGQEIIKRRNLRKDRQNY